MTNAWKIIWRVIAIVGMLGAGCYLLNRILAVYFGSYDEK